MKLLSWLLIFCFFTTHSMASTIREGLQTAMNDYEYQMVVEWDQKNTAQAEAFTKAFTARINELYAQGLSDAELMKYVESRVKDPKKLAAIRAQAALGAKNGNSAENIVKVLQGSMDSFGNQGASWTGGAAYAAVIVGFLAITALIIWQLVWGQTHRCAVGYTSEVCGYESVCDGYSYDYETGTEYCSSSHDVYSCDDVEYCDKWEKYREF